MAILAASGMSTHMTTATAIAGVTTKIESSDTAALRLEIIEQALAPCPEDHRRVLAVVRYLTR